MKMNEQEKTLLVWANCKHKTPGQEVEFGKLGLTAQEWDSAIERLNVLGLVDAFSRGFTSAALASDEDYSGRPASGKRTRHGQ